MVEKGIRRGICHSTYQYTKADNKYLKDYDKNTESPYLQYQDLNNLQGWVMSQKLSVNNFERIKKSSQLIEDFVKTYKEESDEGYFFEVDVQQIEKLHELHNDLPLLSERMNTKKFENMEARLHDCMLLSYHVRVSE